ncbi:MAG: hypothetical protein LBL09_01660 [Oscillospiraceae bacterium]|jgi:hypothetical protein|nr:hypothetical protein [Oscillospiraceae bacterium]
MGTALRGNCRGMGMGDTEQEGTETGGSCRGRLGTPMGLAGRSQGFAGRLPESGAKMTAAPYMEWRTAVIGMEGCDSRFLCFCYNFGCMGYDAVDFYSCY